MQGVGSMADMMVFKQVTESPKALFGTSKPEAKPKRTPLVLDMGEGSREQGFRLNGSR
jgi:hypothetical protein